MHFFQLKWDEVIDLPITKYNIFLDQAFNLLAGLRQSEYSLISEEDKKLKDTALYNAWKEFEQHKGEI